MDMGAESQQQTSYSSLAGTRAMPGSAGSAPHLQSNKAQLQIPPDLKDPSVPRSLCPPAPALLHAWLWDSQHSEWDSTAPHSPQHSSTQSPTQLRQEQGQETQSFELCSCLQTLVLAGRFLAWLCCRCCQSSSGMRP